MQNTSEPYYVESSMEERERIERKVKSFNPRQSTNLEKKGAGSVNTSSVIPESSDSEEDKKSARRCLRLNRKPNEILKEKKQTLFKTNYAECEYFASSSTKLDKNKETLCDAINTVEKNINSEHLQTPKKHNKQKNSILSDSDTDSVHSTHSSKRSPRKEWVGPDIRLNLKDLGLNKQLGSWIESIQKKPAMSIVPVSFNYKI